jgi:FkbM family methyltransferase
MFKFFKSLTYKKSYSQCGEDVIIDFIFKHKNINSPNYLDIGANDARKLNNTYFFYATGSKGVLVEPNIAMKNSIVRYRPNDVFINCGVGIGEESLLDYYRMDWHEFNTFSKENAYATQEYYKGKNNIKDIIKLKLIPIDKILMEYFSNGLDLLSLDVEGLDFQILKSINYDLYSPKVICVETTIAGDYGGDEILDLLISKGYKLYSKTPINSIFVLETFFFT